MQSIFQTPGRAARGRTRLTAIALAAGLPLAVALAVALPAAAQEEVDPMDVMRSAFEACLASGVEGADCAALAKSDLGQIMSGDTTSVSTGSEAPTEPTGTSAGSMTNDSSGQDGQRSNGGDQGTAEDTGVAPGDQSAPTEAAPIPDDAAPSDQAPADQPPAESSAPPADTTQAPAATDQPVTTTTTTGDSNGVTSLVSGGAQSDDASGTDGEPRR